MKLLLDECVVRDLKRDLAGHEVLTVVEAGFGGLENGQLLRAAAGKYDVLITRRSKPSISTKHWTIANCAINSHLERHYLLRSKASRSWNSFSAFDYKSRAYLPRQLVSLFLSLLCLFVARAASRTACLGG